MITVITLTWRLYVIQITVRQPHVPVLRNSRGKVAVLRVSFKPLATASLRFANVSIPSGCKQDFQIRLGTRKKAGALSLRLLDTTTEPRRRVGPKDSSCDASLPARPEALCRAAPDRK